LKYFLSFIIFVTCCCNLNTGHAQFTRQDSLRGSLGPQRTWWNVTKYSITVEPNYAFRTIKGSTVIAFEAIAEGKIMQVDLQSPMEIDSVRILKGERAQGYKTISPNEIRREGNAYFINTPGFTKTDKGQIVLFFSGQPRVATNPPWDGGWIWKKDAKGRPWMSVACQGLGASVWYPCKDHQSDEPDNGADLTIIVADSLAAIGNGKLLEKIKLENGRTAWKWGVKNPINNYNIIPYIGKYATWQDDHAGEKGTLSGNFWVLDYNLEKAKKQFTRDVPRTLKAFEHWFGPYPFYEDGFKLVESPHLGMEHQSAVAYGNHYMDGYMGMDLSGTGWGKKWDYIIVHETGHEWFGNNITTKDIADMWVHEGFTSYSETLFVDYHYGTPAGNEYLQGLRKGISNTQPVIGTYGVNTEGSGDMYPKGANLIHIIRQLVNNDIKFREILRGLNSHFYHTTTTSAEVERYIAEKSGKDLAKIFDQYLRNSELPVLEYKMQSGKLMCRWTHCVPGFNLPLRLAGADEWIFPTTEWKNFTLSKKQKSNFQPDKNFYILVKNLDAN